MMEIKHRLPFQPGQVIFRLRAAADRVKLVADFAGWEDQPIDLRQEENGLWQITVELPPGRYEYRFLVDGQWHDDPTCSGSERNSYGTSNAVVVVT